VTLRAKIVVLVVGLTAAILAGLWLLLSRSWAGWSADAVDRELVARAGAIAALVELDDGELELEHEHDARALRDPDHPYRILAPGGVVLAGGGELAWPPPGRGRGAPWAGSVEDAAGRTWRVVSAAHVVEGKRRRGRDAVVIEVQVAGEAAPHRALEERFRSGLLVALAAALVVGGAGSALLAHLSLAPLRRVAAQVDSIGAASLERRVDAAGLDPELGRVAGAFNELLARLEEAMSHQRALVSRASHALRTPVATILTRAEVALRRERDPAAYRGALEDVAAAAREAAALVQHLLTLARLDERRGPAAREEVALAPLADEIVRLLSPRAGEAGVALESAAAEALVVRADPAAIRELLEALLDNAVHYTPRGGRAGVRATATAAGPALVVWDTGPGIPPEERPRAFERFQRGAAALAAGKPGSGLGLAIVKAIADAHGAAVTLGDRPGGGLVVTVTFPPDAARPSVASPEATRSSGPAQAGVSAPRPPGSSTGTGSGPGP
jgi:signal transduction histidine kinase